jgi:glutamate dehydrogenase/leucine dehydrogenase
LPTNGATGSWPCPTSRAASTTRSGLDIPKLLGHLRESGSVVDFPGSEQITNEDLLELDVDILIPAALGEVITHRNADKLSDRLKLIIEGANHPVTPVADSMLYDRGVMVVPDILANAGGVTVSYYEWVQNNQEMRWEESEVNQRLEKKLKRAFRQCREFQQQAKETEGAVSMREAAFALAVNRVVEAAKLRGYL